MTREDSCASPKQSFIKVELNGIQFCSEDTTSRVWCKDFSLVLKKILDLLWRFSTAAMLHGRNNEIVLHKKEHFFSHGKKKSIVLAMRKSCRAKPPYKLKNIFFM